MKTIDIEHLWTKEVHKVDVISITVCSVDFMWPLAGTYTLDLRTNTVKARSIRARRKQPFVLWRARDLEAVRRMVFEHFNPKHDEFKESVEKHNRNMPHARTLP